uniref:FAD-binding FR-type domain-containing protein n=1 Tax=Branchiostoma floridae TaxID=7739 RepID=C3XVJ8_BRAFL|eukprot:XP_002612115.1 hypothetical protein BRAFLDRAFT_96092 [Branchiostoma floridae]
MWLYLLCGATLLIAYVLHTLLTTSGSSYGGNSLEAFISQEGDLATEKMIDRSADRYSVNYTDPGKQVLVMFGTEYGCSEEVAKKLFDSVASLPLDGSGARLQPRLVNAQQHSAVDWSQERVLLMVISTSGDDLRATQLVPRSDVDQEDWSVIDSWIDAVLDVLPAVAIETKLDYLSLDAVSSDQAYHRTRPFMATMTVKRSLTVQETSDDKETIHCEFELAGSGLTFTAGDALGIYPQNNPAEVRAVLTALQATGTELVAAPSWVYHPQPDGKIPLEEALMKYYDLKHVNPELVKLLTKHTSNRKERLEGERLLKDGDPEKASVTAAVVRYSLHGIPRTGVTTTYLQDRLQVNQLCPVFISHTPDFRLPSNNNLSIIMIGPGTGIAPFMAFIQERALFSRVPLPESWTKNRSLRLRVAFSRDQDKKIYVQDLLQTDAKNIWRHLQNGAHVYVCGDARHMAHDVHQALTDICQGQGDMDAGQARTFLLEMEQVNRYQKDVWVT